MWRELEYRAAVVSCLVVILGIAALISPAYGAEKRPSPPPPRAVQQFRPVQQPRPVQQFRPTQQSGFGQRPNTFAMPQSNLRDNRNPGARGGASLSGYPAARRPFGAQSPFQSGRSEARHFGTTGGVAGTRHFGAADAEFHAANSVPRRIQGGRGYVYRGHTFSRFRADPYRWPHGYSYRRYVVGYVLPRRFWVHDYFYRRLHGLRSRSAAVEL